MGLRTKRNDGIFRRIVSIATIICVVLSSKTLVWDPNVPYRFIRRDVLEKLLVHIPEDFYLANILVSVLCKRLSPDGIKYIPIHFRNRYGGSPSVKILSFVTLGIELQNALKRFNKFYYQLHLNDYTNSNHKKVG